MVAIPAFRIPGKTAQMDSAMSGKILNLHSIMKNKQTNSESFVRKILFNEVSLFLALIGAVLSVFVYITKPQQSADVAIEVLKSQNEAQDKTIDDLITNERNDLHTVQEKLDAQNVQIQSLMVEIGQLQSIIDERIPKKK